MTQLIDKSDLVAEIKKRIKETESMRSMVDPFWEGQISAFDCVLKILDTFETKEVDLEKEIKNYLDKQPIVTKSKGIDYKLVPSPEVIAKHFFELGLKGQKL